MTYSDLFKMRQFLPRHLLDVCLGIPLFDIYMSLENMGKMSLYPPMQTVKNHNYDYICSRSMLIKVR